jgi:hypothetical protein
LAYTDVHIEYKGKKINVKIHKTGLETDEQLEQMAIELMDKLYKSDAVRRHFKREEYK